MRYFLAFLLALFANIAQAQQTQVQWGYLAGFPSQIQFKVGPTWFPIGTFDGVTFTPSGAGTVTSVGLTAPAIFSVAGSPVTTTGVLALTLVTQTANRFFAGPTGGGPAAPTFRAIVPADVPVMVGDSGAGGTAGLVPAPAAGDAAAGRFLSAAGTWQVPQPTSYLTDAVSQCGADPTGVADSTSAINTCLTTFGAVGLRAGTYKTSAAISVPTHASLIGAGSGLTSIIINSTSAVGVAVDPTAQQVRLSGFTVSRVGVPLSGAWGVTTDIATGIGQSIFYDIRSENHDVGFVLGPTDYSKCESCVAFNNYSDGFFFKNNVTTQAIQWQLTNTLSMMNDGFGYHMVAAAGTTNTIQGMPWVGVETFANSGGGISFLGQVGSPINDISISSCVLSYDGNDELQIQSYGGINNKVSDCLIEGAGRGPTGRNLATPASSVGNGVYVLAGISDFTFTNNKVSYNSAYGVIIAQDIDSLIVTNNSFIRNSLTAPNVVDGLYIDGTTILKSIVANNTALNVSGNEQRYGIVVNPAPTSSIVTGNTSSGQTAGCFLTDASIIYGNAGIGCDGRYISSSIAVGSAVALTSSVAANVTSISLPAGEWECSGNVVTNPAGGATETGIQGWISTVSATVPTKPNAGMATAIFHTGTANIGLTLPTGSGHISLGATTTVYLGVQAFFAPGTDAAYGFIGCSRAL